MQTYDANKSKTEVRQGNKRLMNLRVLMISGTVVIIGFAIIFLISSMMN